MSTASILAVGQDDFLLNTRSSVLRTAGYVVKPVVSLTQAFHQFLKGDFDLVLLCHSIPLQERDRLICAIRASGSPVAILVVAPVRQECSRGLANALIDGHPTALIQGIGNALRSAEIRRQPERAASGLSESNVTEISHKIRV